VRILRHWTVARHSGSCRAGKSDTDIEVRISQVTSVSGRALPGRRTTELRFDLKFVDRAW